MRTTVTLDDRLVTELKRMSAHTGRPFKEVINETIRAGLAVRKQRPPPSPYHLRPSSLGVPRVAVTFEKALQLADELEDAALLSKLEQRK